MDNDKEFEDRQERNRRIKDVEYQIEQEQEKANQRKKKENDRLAKERKKEEKKRQEQRVLNEKHAKETAQKKSQQKQEQQQARNDMEKIRQNKANLKNASPAVENVQKSQVATNEPAATAGNTSSNSLAADSVSTDVYLDGKKVSEKELPADLVKKIRKEQNKAVGETQKEIDNFNEGNLSSNDHIIQNGDDNVVARNKINSAARNYTSLSSNNSELSNNIGNSNITGMNVDMKKGKSSNFAKVPINNGVSQNSKTSGGESFNNSNGSKENNENNNINSNNNNNRVDNRDAVQAALAGLYNKSPNSGKSIDNLDSSKNKNNNNSGIFVAPPIGNVNQDLPPKAENSNPIRNQKRNSNMSNSNQNIHSRSLDEDLTQNFAQNMGRTMRATNSMAKKSTGAFKTVKTALKAKKVLALAPIVGFLSLIVLILIVLIGLISFIMNMPGMVRDKIVDFGDNMWQEFKGIIVGGKDQPTSTQVKNLAEYLEKMGYDLKYNGFATKLEKDDKGNIKEIESKYLAAYLAAEQRGYLIANQNRNVKDIFTSFWNGSDSAYWGTGMVVLEDTAVTTIFEGVSEVIDSMLDMWSELTSFFTGEENTSTRPKNELKNINAILSRVQIKRDTKEMFISKVDIKDNQVGYDVYRYSLKEWTEKYGTPAEFFISMHLSTRAPEFAYNFATTYDTKVFVGVKELEKVKIDLVYAETDKDNKIKLDENGKPIMIPISQMSDEVIKSKGISQEALAEMKKVDNTTITAFTPYITKVMNHWYYQQIIYQGEYEGKKIDVYKEEPLEEGKDGYVRYYAYTRHKNDDQDKIEDDSKKVEPAGNSSLMGLINIAIKVMQTAFTGGYSGISGLWDAASETMLNEAYSMLEDAVVDQISDQVLDLLPDELAGMLNVKEFLKGNLSFSQLEKLYENGINLNNMSEFLDFNKITDMMNIDNLQMNVEKMWDELNLKDELMNMDLGGLGSINDLQDVVSNMNIDNINKMFNEQFDKITDLANVNFDALTDKLVGGFSDSISSIQDSIVKSCDELFSGLSEADFNKISDRLLGDVTKQISDLTATPIIDQLNGQIEQLVAGKFNGEILSGLQNEFSKQLTGLSYESLSQMANIPNMDFNTLKNVSGQVTGITSALKGAETSIGNLSNNANKLVQDITGLDNSVLGAVSKTVSEAEGKITSLSGEAQELQKILSSSNITTAQAQELKQKVTELQNATQRLQEANSKLDITQINAAQQEINKYKSDISSITNTLKGADSQTIGKVQSQVAKLESQANSVVQHVSSFDTQALNTLKYKVASLDKTGLVNLATNFNNLDVAKNGMKNLVQQYGTDISGLNTSQINMLMNQINGQNASAQQALNGVKNYLMNVDETGLTRNLTQLNSTVNMLTNATKNLDANTVANLANKIPGFDSLHLNNIASQISNLQNTTVDQLLNKVETLPQQIVAQVSNNLTQKITAGVKDQISANLSQKLKGNLLNSNNFGGNLKNAMTSGPKEDIDTDTQDEAIEASYSEYSTGFYVREIRTMDYFQKAEPLRVLYPARHWIKLFREDKYVILDNGADNMEKVEDKDYIEKYGKTIWEATDGQFATGMYAMLQSIQSSESEYLFRYLKELFNDFGWIFDGNWGFSSTVDPNAINPDSIGWIFKTVKVQEPVYVGEKVQIGSSLVKDLIGSSKYGSSYYLLENPNQKLDVKEFMQQNMPSGAETYSYKLEEKSGKIYVKFTYRDKDGKEKANKIVETDEHVDLAEIGLDNCPDGLFYSNYDIETFKAMTLTVSYFKYQNSELQTVEKAEFEPYTWGASKIGILNSKKTDPVYGFDKDIEIVSPVNGVVVAKTEAKVNELGEKVAQSITIELRDTGDPKADGMRIILIGGDYSGLMVGSLVRQKDYTLDKDGNYIGDTSNSVIGKTTDEPIKIMVLDKDQTPVDDVSQYIAPPYEQYKAIPGN